MDKKKITKDIVIDVIIAVALVLFITYFFRTTIVKQSSMEDTLHENDYLMMRNHAYSENRLPEYGDIVVFESNEKDASGKSRLLIKRVIGCPGDVITIKNGDVYRNNEKLTEPYLKDGDGSTTGDIDNLTIEDNHIFVMGDNRTVSYDSRYEEIGQVPISKIRGKVLFRILPLKKFGKI